MPLIPSFSGYAQKPDLAGAAASGTALVLRRQEIANQAAQAAQSLANERARIAAQERIANMEMQARQEQAARDSQLEQVRLNISQAYNQQRLGLEKAQLDLSEKRLQLDTMEALQDPFSASGRMIDVGGSQIPVVEVERGRFVVPPSTYNKGAGELKTTPVPGLPGHVMVETPDGRQSIRRVVEPENVKAARKEMMELENTTPGLNTGQMPKLSRRRADEWNQKKARYDELKETVNRYDESLQMQPESQPGVGAAPPAPPVPPAPPGASAPIPQGVTRGYYHSGTEKEHNEKQRAMRQGKSIKVGNYEVFITE